jgi:rhamnulose-1-phosphate aldolase/alcohol dehydrogenase
MRGAVGNVIGHFEAGEDVERFVNSARAQALSFQGTSCPDHFVRTKVRPLYVEWNSEDGGAAALKSAVDAGFERYRKEYAEYYETNKLPDSPAMRSTSPTVVLVPGVGMFSFGRSKAEARITGEFYENAIHVMEGATALDGEGTLTEKGSVDNYVALPLREAFNIEYWKLEEAKLKRLPPEKELSRKVAVVVGVSPGIGRSICHKLAAEGAHVVCADLVTELAEEAAEELAAKYGKDVAVAETVDCTNRESVRSMLDRASLHFGGVDILVQVAAVFFPPGDNGRVTEEQWRKTLDVNLTGAMLAADEAQRVMAEHGTEGSIVLISSANAVVPKKGSWAYDTGKAAMNHLVREMAVEFAPKVRVNGIAPASVVEGSLQFPRERVISSLEKYGIAFGDSESTEDLRAKLAGFYSERTLLKKTIVPEDIALAAFLLNSKALGKTTGQIIAVDAGLPEAFLR